MIQLKVRTITGVCRICELTNWQTMLNCIDNSGAAIVECVAVMRKKRQAARIGRSSVESSWSNH